MDFQLVEDRARFLLPTLQRFQHPTDSNSWITVANNNDGSWATIPGNLRLNTRAIDLLTRLKFVHTIPGTNAYEITELGRSVLSSGWPDEWSAEWLAEWIETQELLESLDARRLTSENTLSELVIQDWRQFASIDVLFHPKVTILTGANGAGKTTLLNILGPHFGWPVQLLTRRNQSPPIAREVGHLSYSNGGRSSLYEPPVGSGIQSAPLTLTEMQHVAGLFVNSHRSISSYQPLTSLPPRFSEWSTLQQQFTAEIQTRYAGGSSQHSPLYRMKEALVAAAMFAYGNPAVRPNDSARELWEGYQETLRQFLPGPLGFTGLTVEDSEIILLTETAEFPLEAVSGGISAMLELSWQIYLRQRDQEAFTVCIDEPENHLHPELQRSILPSLAAAFPEVTFIIATHSPLVVTSTQDSHVYALDTDDGSITSRRVTDLGTSSTPDETLMSVLGLDTTLPIWAESRLTEILGEMPISPNASDLRKLRDELRRLGLERQFPAAVRSLERGSID